MSVLSTSLADKRVWVAGHRGMVGSALVRRLAREGCQVLTVDRALVDLERQADVEKWMEHERPDAVIVAAARVGGIHANSSHPVDFLYRNLMIEANVISASAEAGVPRLLFLGSSCIYPRLAPQPIVESTLLSGPLEPTNEWYAIAKIAGIKLAQAYRREYGLDYISAMPTNLYGPEDNFDLDSSHVIPALIRKAHEAKVSNCGVLKVWGSGTPMREFLHVDDCADALVHLLKTYSGDEHVNVGSGEDLPILELAAAVAQAVGFTGDISTDPAKPDGTPRKLMSADKLRALGWRPKIGLRDGLQATYEWFLAHVAHQGDCELARQ
jgi:GDP-L-fucose synthase